MLGGGRETGRAGDELLRPRRFFGEFESGSDIDARVLWCHVCVSLPGTIDSFRVEAVDGEGDGEGDGDGDAGARMVALAEDLGAVVVVVLEGVGEDRREGLGT